MFLTTKPFKSIFDDPIWKELETTTSTIFNGYHSEKTDDGYILEMAVPGLGKKDLSVKIVKGRLNIKSDVETKWLSSFEKTFVLPEESDSKKIKATVENGVLTVRIPTKEDAEKIVEVL
jgi:HSP20 family protein